MNLVTVLSGESRRFGVIELGLSLRLRRILEKAMIKDKRVEAFSRDIELFMDQQVEVINLGEGAGKQPLSLPKRRAADVSLIYVDPIKGVLYVIPRQRDRPFFALAVSDRPHSGA